MDLSTSLPLRVWIGELANGSHLVAVSGHHIVFDGWTFKLFYEELQALYHADQSGHDVPPPLSQYWDVSTPTPYTEDLERWRSLLGRPYEAIRALHARATGSVGPGAVKRARLPDGLAVSLHRLARTHRTTPFIIASAAMLSALSDVLGTTQVLFGSAFSGRVSGAAVRALGYFSTSAFFGTDLNSHSDRTALVDELKEQQFGWQTSRRVQWEDLLDRYAARDLYAVKFACQRASLVRPNLRIQGTEVQRVDPQRGEVLARRPLDLNMSYSAETAEIVATYRHDCFSDAEISALIEQIASNLYPRNHDKESV
jgi:hypothetical protein